VRDLEALVRAPQADDEETATGPVGKPGADVAARRLRPPGLLELEELLSDRLDTRVKVSMGARRGKVTIDFVSLEDLERIYRAMTAPPTED
jgi:ParB family chromosome partitioning protein